MADRFQDIAANIIAMNEMQEEPVPPEIPERYFTYSDEKFPDNIEYAFSKSYEEELAWFDTALEDMRRKYIPFMQDFVPATDSNTKKEEIREFEFRYLKKGEIFSDRDRSDAQWEKVTIPDFRGPAGEEGCWRGYYRSTIYIKKPQENKRVILNFESVDYIAKVYLNGCYAGSHEGFFAPFAFDVTDYIKADDNNELYVECINDIPTLGVGNLIDGDKLYAATGPGWDDPQSGWHHCPAGAGIIGAVTVEYRPQVYVRDIFVMPDLKKHTAQVRIGVDNYSESLLYDYKLEFALYPKNFKGEPLAQTDTVIEYIGKGSNEYRFDIDITGCRLWNTDKPWLYGAVAKLSKETEMSALTQQTGFKEFICDESSAPKGRFYLNGKPAILRGANEMGHLQQCVMKGNKKQLIDDILIAKLCNMNYYRITQRPVQNEIYDYFDMLGMMHQCDLPLFGFLRRPQFAEAVRQSVEMEHLIRSHVSSVMVTFINEPMAIGKTDDPNSKSSKRFITKGHRDLLRDELEAFFAAARNAIYTENPQRVIKNAEGDYEPPTLEGMPDFHCYTMWYSNHAIPIGKLMAGYLPAIRKGWMCGCGEYGAEGLDSYQVMKKYYPKEWLEYDENGEWFPDRIVRAQSHGLSGDWYKEQSTIEDWIRESQIHQARATRLMTDAFRRRADIISHTAIHLLIDAWPSGWMKTLVDCDRIPKRAFFTYRDCLTPLRCSLYTPQKCVYGKENVDVQAWLLNDTGDNERVTLYASFNGKVSSIEAQAPAAASKLTGIIPVKLPDTDRPVKMKLDVCMKKNGSLEIVYAESLEFTVYPSAWKHQGPAEGRIILPTLTKENEKEVSELLADAMKQGKTAVLTWADKDAEISADNNKISLKKCQEVFVASAEKDYEKYELNMIYNENAGYIDIIGSYYIDSQLKGSKKAYTYEREGFSCPPGRQNKLAFVEEFSLGNGKLIAVSLETEGRTGVNANIDALLNGKG